MPFVTIDGTNYHYAAGMPADKEPRQTIVFVHGAGGSHRHWLPQLNFFKNDYLVMAVDLPGHGQSGGESADRISTYREFIFSFAEKLIGHPFFLAGHSMGGAITLDFARCYPEKLAGMLLIGTGARLRVLPDLLDAFARGEIHGNLASLAYGRSAPPSLLEAAWEEIKNVSPLVFLRDYTACDNFDLMAELPAIDVPALVVTGDEDRLTPVKYGRFLAEKLPRAHLEVILEAGHMIMLEKPAELNRVIDQFLKERPLW